MLSLPAKPRQAEGGADFFPTPAASGASTPPAAASTAGLPPPDAVDPESDPVDPRDTKPIWVPDNIRGEDREALSRAGRPGCAIVVRSGPPLSPGARGR
jgi:hypothetical protein